MAASGAGVALLLALLVSVSLPPRTSADGIQTQNQTTRYSGFLVDLYCYGLGLAGSLALDGVDVIRQPEKHTLHCLRDPPQCYKSGYMLAFAEGEGASKEYHAKFLLDDAGNAAVLALLRQYPKGHARDHADGNFALTVTGQHSGDGYLREASIDECKGEGCDSVCDGACVTPRIRPALTPSLFLICHVVCMVLSWGFLLPAGVLMARTLRTQPRKLCGAPIWFQGHRILQSVGWLLQLLGFVFILLHKVQGGGGSAAHFGSPHEAIGLAVVVLGTLQPLNAQLRHLKAVGHVGDDGKRTQLRLYWEYLHKGSGYVAVLLGCLNVVLGIVKAHRTGFGHGLVPAAAALAGVLMGLLFLVFLAFDLSPRLRARCAAAASKKASSARESQ